MPRFSANISMLFQEVELPERFDAAARAGFRAVEIQFPYAFDKEMLAERTRRAGVEVVLINLTAGDFSKGDRGIGCLPGRVAEFRDSIGASIDYARALGVRQMNCLAGCPAGRFDPAKLRETFISNLRFAAGELARAGMDLLIEPVNSRTFPGSYLRNSGQAIAIMDEANVANLKLQYDLFHMQIMEGDLAKTIETILPRIGHIQFADVPERHEPGSGELNFAYLFDQIDRVGYHGWIGAEYVPSAGTVASLDWFEKYRDMNPPVAA
ncbi:MAG: 2-oxo-tetronate isomerase [Burkholderiales bacterium]